MLREKSDKISSKFKIWSLAIVLIASLAVNLYLVRGKNSLTIDKQLLQDKNTQIIQKFETAKKEIKKFKGLSVKLDEVVKDATKKLEDKEQKIRILLNDKKLKEAENKRLMHEVDSIKEQYFDVIDSLLVAQQLNKTLNNTIASLNYRIDDLSAKLGYASRLDIENLTVTPIRKTFVNIETQTALAKRTVKVEVCFEVLDNKVTEPGMKHFYIRILTPDAKVLTDDEEAKTFMYPELNQKVIYTAEETINYKNQKTIICTIWTGTDEYKPGLYIVEIFTIDNKLGTTTFTLK